MTEKLQPFKNKGIEVEFMANNIESFLLNNVKLCGTKLLIGYNKVFMVLIVKYCIGNNECETKFGECNKFIVKLCIDLYVSRWKA